MTIDQMQAQALEHYHAGRFQQADSLAQQILSRQRDPAVAMALLGLLWHEYGRSAQAVDFIQQAIKLDGKPAEWHDALAKVLLAQGAADAAIVAARRAVELRPELAEAHYHLGAALAVKGEFDEAVVELRRALALKQPFAQAELELANVLRQIGELDDAIAGYRRALELTGDSRIASRMLDTLNFHPDYDAARLADEHRKWNQTFAQPLASQIASHRNDRSSDGPLRIGYVSPNFREHPVGRFFLPLLENHDREQFEIYCYSDVRQPDRLTEQIDWLDPLWRNIIGFSDLQVAELVRADQIDILVDLSQHMQDNRLLAFARKPAPVQVTYLGCCGTTGLGTMDYRLTDEFLDPVGVDESWYSERTIQLKNYFCYSAPANAPDAGRLPAATNGAITFGCFSDTGIVNEFSLALWCRLLRELQNARLLIQAPRGIDRILAERAKRHHVDPSRIGFIGGDRNWDAFGEVDIALDSYPRSGDLATCDALWMGVPVVSLAGETAVSRTGTSILAKVGLSDLVVRSADGYVQMAASLASDLTRLKELRSTLRERMRQSALMEASTYASDVESVFRKLWRNWCDKGG